MNLSDFFKFKTRRQVRATIWKAEDAMERMEADISGFKTKLVEYEKDPSAEQWAIDRLRGYIAAMEQNLAEFKLNHARFVAENKRPSSAFPRGIAA
jgi:hypothetical protein